MCFEFELVTNPDVDILKNLILAKKISSILDHES